VKFGSVKISSMAVAVARSVELGYHSAMTQNPATLDPRRLETLRAIVKALRTPETGCPWDLEQNFATIAPYTIEEAYEVADAVERGDMTDLCEELGDLLLQPIYHVQMAEEQGAFTFEDVLEAVNTKMIRRHPHVFGDDAARTAKLAKTFWEDAKSEERADKAAEGVLASVPKALPGLTRALKLQAKAAKVGFDWPSIDDVYDKIAEEIDELKSAVQDRKAGEFGDLLFAMANAARHMGIDPEDALRAANAKFERRFAFIEAELQKREKQPQDSDLAEMDSLWNEAKNQGL
jgi:MazG family protein